MAYPISRPQSIATPLAYTLGPQESFTVESISATWDGTNAASAFIPCVAVYAQDGTLLGRFKGDATVSAGDTSAEATFAPFLRGASGVNLTVVGSGPAPTPVTVPLSTQLSIRAVQPSVANFGAGVNHLGHRVLITQTGFLHDLSVYVGTLVAGTKVEVGILDTSTPTRTILYKSGYVNLTTAQAYNTIGDPAMFVTAGQHLDFSVSLSDVSTVLWIGGLQDSTANATSAELPSNFFPVTGGAPPKLVWSDVVSPRPYGATTTVAEASLTDQLGCPLVVGRIANT